MVNQQVTLSTIVCALLFSCGSMASTHISSPGPALQNLTSQSSEPGTDSDLAVIAAIDSAMFNGMSESNAVTEFAMQVSGFQHESGGTAFSSGARRFDGSAGYLPRVSSGQHGLSASVTDNDSVGYSETGTLVLVALGFAALAVSRRRIKFAHSTGGKAAGPADDAEQPTHQSEADKPKSRTADRNPYPELAQSVQELEALAHEMEHLS